MRGVLGDGRCQVVVDDGGVTCGAPAKVEGTWCRRHDPAKWAADDKQCLYIFDTGHRCLVSRSGGRQDEACTKHRAPCVQCGSMTRKLQGLCRTCGAGKRPRGRLGDDNCQVVVDDGGVTCGAPAKVEGTWCRRHDPAKWAADDKQCLHAFDSGHRCLAQRKKGKRTELCEKHVRDCPTCDHQTYSLGPCKSCAGERPLEKVTLHDEVTLAGLCQAVIDNGGVICGATAQVGCFCRAHDADSWPADNQRCMFIFESGHRCIRHRRKSRYSEVCAVHDQPCVTCGRPTNKLAGLCRSCGRRRGPAYRKRGTHVDGIARLQCEVQIGEGKDGTPSWCQYNTDAGHVRCGIHRKIPPDGRRCHHLFASGQRCPQGIHAKQLGKDDYCTHHFSHRCPGVDEDPCVRVPDGGVKLKRATRTVCRWCEPKLRPPCAWEDDEGKACPKQAQGGDLCAKHARAAQRIPEAEDRCQRVYTSGKRCHRRTLRGGEVCVVHRHVCPAPDCDTLVATNDLAARCRRCGARCGAPKQGGGTCDAPAGPNGAPCMLHDEGARCAAWSVNRDAPCGWPPTSESDYCGTHQPAPDEVRCEADTPRGRCVNRQLEGQRGCKGHLGALGSAREDDEHLRGPDGRLRTVACTVCGFATSSKAGICSECRSDDNRCWATTLTGSRAGKRCRLRPDPGAPDGLCWSHRAQGVPPPDEQRCRQAIGEDDQGQPLRCTGERRPGDELCRVHGGKNRVFCAAWVQDPDGPYGQGKQCRTLALLDGTYCSLHRSLATMDVDDRCVIEYANAPDGVDARCAHQHELSRQGSGGVVCQQHRVACAHDGCSQVTADIDRRLCQTHAPRCVVTVAEGRRCQHPAAAGETVCMVHLTTAAVDPADRCQHTFANGERCRADSRYGAAGRAEHRANYRQLCLQHYIACSEPACPRATAFLDGRCFRHRPQCGWQNGCKRGAISPDGLCERHDRMAAAGLCVLTRINSKPCAHPASHHTDEGLICGRHLTETPEDEDRCTYTHESGTRCPGTRPAHSSADARRLFCAGWHPRRPTCRLTVQTWTTDDGTLTRPCQFPVAVETSEGAICARHASNTADHEVRCLHVFEDGNRCTRTRREEIGQAEALVCPAHGLDQCSALSTLTRGQCSRRVAFDLDGEMVCGLHAARMPAAQDRCTHYDDEGRHCAGRRVWFDGADQTADFCGAHSPHLCALPLANGRACANPARIDVGGEMVCGLHAARMPAAQDRCTHYDDEGRHCAGRRCLGSTGQVLKTCATHIPRKRCSATLESGDPCPWPGAINAWGTPQDRCWRHPVLRDDEQCSAEEDGACCPRRRAHRIAFCADHRHLAPRCARVRHDRQCTQTALDGRDTCDRHASWRPDMPDDALDDLRMFLLAQQDQGRLDRLAWRLLLAREDLADDAWAEAMQNPYLPMSHLASVVRVCSTSVDTEVGGMGGQQCPSPLISDADYLASPEEVRAVLDGSARLDPFDLTGAKAAYTRKLERARERGTEVHWPTLQRTIENLAAGLAKGTLASAASHLRTLHAWMRTNQIPTDQSFDPEDLQDYFGWLTDRGRLADGEPLQHGSVQGIRTAIVQLCRVKRWPDPFEQDPLLAMQIKGYGRLYGRVELRAHAVMVSELSRMVRAAIEQQADPYEVARDRTILALCVGPNRIAYKAAARLRWEHLVHLPEPGADHPARFVLPGKPGAAKSVEQEFLIPNMSVLVTAEDYSAENESVVLCGVQALRSLRASAIRTGRCDDHGNPVGPVFDTTTTGKTGNGMSDEGLRRIVKRTWEVASADGTLFPAYDSEADWDTRYAVARAVGEPSFEELRNAALIVIAWWASLRSEEASALTWGDVTREKRGRGLVLQVRKSKTDQSGTGAFVAIPHHHMRTEDGETVPSIIDAATILSRYQDAWVRKTGRVPNPDDPIFLGKKGALGPQGCRDAFDKLAVAAKLEAELGERLTFHGLRAGFATTTLVGGMPAEEVARRQRRKSTVSLYAYFRLPDPFAGTLAAIFDYDVVGVDVDTMLADANLLSS